MWKNPRRGTNTQLFTVMAAYGYDAVGLNGKVWKLWASPTDDAVAWAEFLDLLPGRPLSVVCDRDLAIIGRGPAHWGRGKNAVPGGSRPQAQASGGQACGYSVNGPTSHSDATVNPAVRRAVRLASS